MIVLTALGFLGLLQTLFVVAGLRSRRVLTCLYCALPSLLGYLLHPWVLQSNFNRLTEFLMSDAIAASIASILILEATIKAFCLIDRSSESPQGVHWLQRVLGILPRKAELLLPYMPSFMLLFLLFYGQAWLFHTIEGYPYKTLSVWTALGLFGFSVLGISLLRRFSATPNFDRLSYDLLFLQFVIAIALPLFAQDTLNAPPLYDASIYLQAATTVGGMLMICVIGYLLSQFVKNRTQQQ